MDSSPSLAEQLANIPIVYIVYFVVVATALRLALVRVKTGPARSGAELIESGLIAFVLVFMLIRPFVLQAYFIPSPSMVPTLLGKNGSGDRILVNKLSYRLSRWWPSLNPKHDDIVVFIPPPAATEGTNEGDGTSPVNYIKRLIAQPGDVIQTTAGRVYVGAQEFDHGKVRAALRDAGIFGQDIDDIDLQADHHVKFTPAGVLADGKLVDDSKLADILTSLPSAPVRIVPGETILNGKVLNEPFTAEDPDYTMKLFHQEPLKYDGSYKLDGSYITQSTYDQDNASPPEAVPPGCYFMMGDNRNDSKDSTEWGPLERNRIVGKAECIFWPVSRVRMVH